MDHTRKMHQAPPAGPRLEGHLARLVTAGRITADDAARVRAAADGGDLEGELRRIRLAHVRARLDAAVLDGRMSDDEAAEVIARVEADEDPRLPHAPGSSRRKLANRAESTDG